MRDLVIAIPGILIAILGGLGIGAILYILAKRYFKNSIRRP